MKITHPPYCKVLFCLELTEVSFAVMRKCIIIFRIFIYWIKTKHNFRMYFLRELLSDQQYLREDGNSSLKKCTSLSNTVKLFIGPLAIYLQKHNKEVLFIARYRVQYDVLRVNHILRRNNNKN